MLKFNTVGKILSGDSAGGFVKVVDDSANSGGFLVIISTSATFDKEVFDDWVEDSGSLCAYFEESNWIVDWQPCPESEIIELQAHFLLFERSKSNKSV